MFDGSERFSAPYIVENRAVNHFLCWFQLNQPATPQVLCSIHLVVCYFFFLIFHALNYFFNNTAMELSQFLN